MNGSETNSLFGRIALIGAGLIGSSLARAVRREHLARHIAVAARSQATLDTMTALGLADSTTLDAAEAAQDADLVVLCTPLGVYEDVARTIAAALKPGAIVSDVGSCKKIMFSDVALHLPGTVHMVPGHPVAGTEHSGPEAGFAELFEGRWCVLTPGPEADKDAVGRVAELWRRCAMNVEFMDADHHDQVLALTSHLPHLIAYTIVGTATDLEDDLKKEVFKYSASGFRDFTRIAASDPVMWRDIFLKNSDAVLDVLGRFTEDLTSLQRIIRRGEADKLEAHFNRTRDIRRGVIDAKQE
jgi:cyclohexadieny/prephenate dehydrogenase